MNFLDGGFTVGQARRVEARKTRTDSAAEPTYSLGAVARMTGLSQHVLRAWERRYGAVQPIRSPGGTRRYCEADVRRLRLLRSAVLAGHAISEVAGETEEALARRLELRAAPPPPALAPVLGALEHLDGPEASRLLGHQLSALGANEFVRRVATPLLAEIGVRWSAGSLCVAAEHLASATLRNLLGAALQPRSEALRTAPILFTTLPGDHHDLGVFLAAVATVEAGGYALFAGGNLPVAEIVDAVDTTGAAAVAVGLAFDDGSAADSLQALRQQLPRHTELWIGGRGANGAKLPSNVCRVPDFDDLERKVRLLLERRAPS